MKKTKRYSKKKMQSVLSSFELGTRLMLQDREKFERYLNELDQYIEKKGIMITLPGVKELSML